MTINDAIAQAALWQEQPEHPASLEECQRLASAFAFALTYLHLEIEVSMERLAEADYGHGPLGQRVEAAISAARSKRS